MPHGRLNWELRSVNQRYLDVTWRLPEAFRVLEAECRELLSSRIKRGKIEAVLRYEPFNNTQAFTINLGLVSALVNAADTIAEHVVASPLNTIDLLQWPGVLESSTDDLATQKPALLQAHEDAMQCFEQALLTLQETRQAEGQRITGLFDAKLESMADYVADIRAQQPQIREQLQQKLMQRLDQIADDITFDDHRLEQEMVVQLQKIDVAEELDRLDAHINEFDQTLLIESANPHPIGQRLNFICQEMLREANTLGSKSQALAQTHTAIELKLLIDQIREQVQNVE